MCYPSRSIMCRLTPPRIEPTENVEGIVTGSLVPGGAQPTMPPFDSADMRCDPADSLVPALCRHR